MVAALALLVVATILLVLFVSTTALDRSASYTYSQSMKADQIGLGGLHLIVGQLQAEMYKDQMPDTNGVASPYIPIFTNVASYNILPQANVTNSSLPALIKMSTNAYFFSGTNSVTAYDTGMLQASTMSSTTPSLNSRSVSTNVWNQIFMGQYPNSAAAPYWVIVTRGGPTNASGLTFGTTGNTLNNPATANVNYAIGRMAYAIYDEGGLLDINAAGYPGTGTLAPLSAAQLNQIKGTLAGADLTQIPGITSPSTFIQWRNAASAAAASTFVSYVTNFASTNGFQQAYPGDSAFISRQDLIRAAQTGGEGLTTNALPYLATFTRELNAPSWAPSVTVPSTTAAKYNYPNNATNLTSATYFAGYPLAKHNPNPYVPFVRYTTGGTVTGYRSDGTTYTYTVRAGDSVVQHRFPLDRLNWIGPGGPNAAAFNPSLTAQQQRDAIQACFGLYYGASENILTDANWTGISVWKYVGSGTGATSATKEKISSSQTTSAIETLSDVAAEASPREPNFFELLQAGVLYGSIALTSGTASNMESSGENYSTLQLLRIGASIISQVQTQAYPITIEYNQNDGGNFSVDVSGAANLPYVNILKFITGQSPQDSGSGGTHQMAAYGLFGLWNPHQQASTAVTRPAVRLYLQGSISAGSGWSYGQSGYSTLENGGAGNIVYGKSYTLAANTYYITLSSTAGVGVNGFLNPYTITSADAGAVGGGAGSNTSLGWTSATSSFVLSTDPEYANLTANSSTYEAFRVPDFTINLGLTGANAPTTGNTALDGNHDIVWLGNTTSVTTLSPFQLILKYQDPSGNWVPYDYWVGYNCSATSWPATKELRDCYYGTPTSGSTPPTLESVLHSTSAHSAVVLTTDPRTMRFGTFPFSGDNPTGALNGNITNPMIESLWSGNPAGNAGNPNTPAQFSASGYASGTGTGIPGEGGVYPAVFAGTYVPADLSRNNNANTSSGNSANPGAYFSAYADNDGIQRIADSGLFSTSAIFPFAYPPNTGNPYYDPNDVPNTSSPSQRTADRPIILNRPFASVGELGYVYRDDPWRTLDFCSVSNLAQFSSAASTSGDSGLLDLFSVTDSPNTVVAGRINLNTKNSTVLQAILSGTTANTGDTVNNTGVTSLGNPSGMASALSSFTLSSPLVNKDQLVTRFNPSLGSGNTVNAAFASSDEQNVKPYREGYIRALSDVGQTRTWNLLIDLVAQAGKYPSTAADLSQFEVEGERHYWLHVAIDRFTGKIIDRQLELIGP